MVQIEGVRGFLVHDQLIVDEVETVGFGLVRMGDHVFD